MWPLCLDPVERRYKRSIAKLVRPREQSLHAVFWTADSWRGRDQNIVTAFVALPAPLYLLLFHRPAVDFPLVAVLAVRHEHVAQAVRNLISTNEAKLRILNSNMRADNLVPQIVILWLPA